MIHFFSRLCRLRHEENPETCEAKKYQYRARRNKKLSGEFHFFHLITYSYILGIRDLHHQNLILTETHLQAIDAEVVLTDLLLPTETILLPFKDTTFESCGLRVLAATAAAIGSGDCERIFAGYFDLFAAVVMYRSAINETFLDQDLRAPIRIILRNTREYRPYLNGAVSPGELLNEERIQVERGDVPYFFKYADDSNLYWLSNPGEVARVDSALGSFQADVDRHAKNPMQLLSEDQALIRKMVQGAFLLQKHLGDNERRKFQWRAQPLTLSIESCEILAANQTYRKKV